MLPISLNDAADPKATPSKPTDGADPYAAYALLRNKDNDDD